MDNSIVGELNWKPTKISYRCFFGELPVFNLKINGVKTAPNIFETATQLPEPAPGKKLVSHAYSLPCNEQVKKGIMIKDGYLYDVDSVYKHYFVDTSEDFDSYLTRFKGKTLNSLKRKIKKVERSNFQEESVRIFKTPEAVNEFISLAKEISETSYQEKLLGRVLPMDADFIKKMKTLAEEDRFRGYILYAEDTPIAYNLCPIYGQGILLYDYTGYNPEYNKYSAGTVLQYKIIEQCFFEKQIAVYDLCTGEGKHKEFFATGYKTCCDVFYFPATPFYIISVFLRKAINSTGRSIIAVLDRFGVKNRIKTLIRRVR